MTRVEAVRDILQELTRAEVKFPEWPQDPIHAAAIVAEESGELTRAALQSTYEGGDPAAMKKEAIHTATMALRFLLHDYAAAVRDFNQIK